jgi:hypothetical protein
MNRCIELVQRLSYTEMHGQRNIKKMNNKCFMIHHFVSCWVRYLLTPCTCVCSVWSSWCYAKLSKPEFKQCCCFIDVSILPSVLPPASSNSVALCRFMRTVTGRQAPFCSVECPLAKYSCSNSAPTRPAQQVESYRAGWEDCKRKQVNKIHSLLDLRS